MEQGKHGWDDQEERGRNQNENTNKEENGGQNALRNSANETDDDTTINDIADQGQDTNSTEGLNKRADETEPFDQDNDENGQGSTSGEDYGTRQADTVGEGGPGRNSNQQDAERNREDLSDRGEDEG